MTIVLVPKIRKYLKVTLDYCFIIHLSWLNCMPTFCTGVCTCIYCVLRHGMALLKSRQIPWDEDRGSGQETFMPDVKIPLEGTWAALQSHKESGGTWTFAHNDKCSHFISFSSVSKTMQWNTPKWNNSITLYGLSFERSTSEGWSDSSAISIPLLFISWFVCAFSIC